MGKSYLWRVPMAACLALTACQNWQSFAAQPCNGGVCKVSIVITDCTTSTGFMVPDTLDVTDAKNIQWDITGPYSFTRNGIDIPTGGSVFDGKNAGAKKFIWHDKHNESSLPVKYKYTVNVVPDSGPASCIALDPFINNK
jgi:hypothetical protein